MIGIEEALEFERMTHPEETDDEFAWRMYLDARGFAECSILDLAFNAIDDEVRNAANHYIFENAKRLPTLWVGWQNMALDNLVCDAE